MGGKLRMGMGYLMIFGSLALFLSAISLAWGEDLAPGKKLFEGKCAQCHGKDAKGVAKMAKVLKVEPNAVDLTREEAAKLTTAEKLKIVSDGKKKMPKYKGKLTDEEIQSAVKYLESLQGGGAKKK